MSRYRRRALILRVAVAVVFLAVAAGVTVPALAGERAVVTAGVGESDLALTGVALSLAPDPGFAQEDIFFGVEVTVHNFGDLDLPDGNLQVVFEFVLPVGGTVSFEAGLYTQGGEATCGRRSCTVRFGRGLAEGADFSFRFVVAQASYSAGTSMLFIAQDSANVGGESDERNNRFSVPI